MQALQDDKLEEALENLLTAAKVDDRNAELQVELAKLNRRIGDYMQMEAAASRATDLDDIRVEALMVLGEALVENGKKEEQLEASIIKSGVENLRKAMELSKNADIQKSQSISDGRVVEIEQEYRIAAKCLYLK